MKHPLVFALALTVAAIAPVSAQEKTPKTERKTLTFPAGAKVPEATPPPAAVATPKPVEKPADRPFSVPAPGGVPTGPAQIVNTFFTQVGQGDIDGAYAGLTKGSKIAERPEELRSLKTKTKEAIEVFGVVHGYDLVSSKPVGERLVRVTYVSLGHEYPLRWRFYFYKAETVWKLIDLRVDDKLTGIFEETEEPKPAEAK